MTIFKITKKEYLKIKRDQEWKVYEWLLFRYDGVHYKCSTLGAAGLNEINRFQKARRDIKRDQLDLLGLGMHDTL